VRRNIRLEPAQKRNNESRRVLDRHQIGRAEEDHAKPKQEWQPVFYKTHEIHPFGGRRITCKLDAVITVAATVAKIASCPTPTSVPPTSRAPLRLSRSSWSAIGAGGVSNLSSAKNSQRKSGLENHGKSLIDQKRK